MFYDLMDNSNDFSVVDLPSLVTYGRIGPLPLKHSQDVYIQNSRFTSPGTSWYS